MERQQLRAWELRLRLWQDEDSPHWFERGDGQLVQSSALLLQQLVLMTTTWLPLVLLLEV